MFILMFSKRFSSGFGFPLAYATRVWDDDPVPVRYGWVRLAMSESEAEAVLRFASREAHYSRVELLADDGSAVIGRKADDMRAAKGFSTPRPRLPETYDDVPTVTVEDVRKYLLGKKYVSSRSEVQLALDIGLVTVQKLMVNGHQLFRVDLPSGGYVLPKDPSDILTSRAIAHLWAVGGKVDHAAKYLWPREEMLWFRDGLPESTPVAYEWPGGDRSQPFRVITTSFPGVVVVEGFWAHGRYRWFSTDPTFVPTVSGHVKDHMVGPEGKLIFRGFHRDHLPRGEGWDFALGLHRELSRVPSLDFTVEGPAAWSSVQQTVSFRLQPEELADKIRQWLGWHLEVESSKWSAETAQRIAAAVRQALAGKKITIPTIYPH